jgi:hypothetical protein
MTNGFETAKTQRNFLERLVDKIPGFQGFQNRELRRDVDKLLREHLSAELTRIKGTVRSRTRDYTDAGKIGALNGFDRLDRKLDGLSQSVRFADYGATGFFDAVKIGEPELDRLYQFDASIQDDIAQIEGALAAVPPPGADAPDAALDQVRDLVDALDAKWKRREEVIGQAVTGLNA